VSATHVCPGHGRGILHFRGVRPLDLSARYRSETGIPLMTAAQVAEFCGVKNRTVYQWVRRGKLELTGLGNDGEQLFSAADVALMHQPAAA
jgi:excisionase family DNA binding protein